MNATRAMAVLVGLFLAATPAGAMTGQDFLQVSDKSAVDEMAVLKPVVRQFVREGYHSIPDWAEPSEMVRALILQKGYRDEDIAEIAREAAIANGMSK
jgi:SOS response regulatory protein OraA/RecX